MSINNTVIIGYKSGIKLVDGNSILIIGDNIPDLNQPQKDVFFINKKTAIGKYVLGERNSLYDILLKMFPKIPEFPECRKECGVCGSIEPISEFEKNGHKHVIRKAMIYISVLSIPIALFTSAILRYYNS